MFAKYEIEKAYDFRHKVFRLTARTVAAWIRWKCVEGGEGMETILIRIYPKMNS